MPRIVRSSGNVYADIGHADAQGMLLKAGLAAEIGRILRNRHLSQLRAAEILGISQPKLSNLLRGQFRGISEAKMIECLTRLGQDVKIEIRPAVRTRIRGEVRVSRVAAPKRDKSISVTALKGMFGKANRRVPIEKLSAVITK